MEARTKGKTPTEEAEAMRRVVAYLLVYYKALAKKHPRKRKDVVC
jgi:hypothetical protein